MAARRSAVIRWACPDIRRKLGNGRSDKGVCLNLLNRWSLCGIKSKHTADKLASTIRYGGLFWEIIVAFLNFFISRLYVCTLKWWPASQHDESA